jgi:plasmid stabilization system protein ParE
METELTRRRLAQIAAGVMTAVGATPAAAQQQASPDTASYSGPLSDGKPPEGRHFDPVAYSRAQFDAVQRQLGFQARTRAQAQAWQKRLRAKVTELVGGFPNQRVPLRPVTLETREFPAYRRETIVFESRPG